MMVGAGVSINQRNMTAKPQGPNPLYLPEVSRWYIQKTGQVDQKYTRPRSKPKPPTGRRPGGSVNAR